jgi:hypothetical protein
MRSVADTVALFAHQNYFVPCPAAPPAGAVTPTGIADCTRTVGIVPYATLGLKFEQIRDGYSNYLTYGVSPVLTQPNLNNVTVDEQCRYQKIWVIPIEPVNQALASGPGVALNPAKARFCCPLAATAPGVGSDLQINNGAGAAMVPLLARNAANGNTVNQYQVPPAATVAASRTQVPAIVLVSHGHNGVGAFVPAGRIAGNVGNNEAANRDGDRTYVAADYNKSPGANYFDDIVMWRTQDQLMSAFGRDNCSRP